MSKGSYLENGGIDEKKTQIILNFSKLFET